MHQTLIFGQDVAKSEDERRVRDYRLQINDILFLLSFDLGKICFFGVTFIAVDRRTEDWKRFDAY